MDFDPHPLGSYSLVVTAPSPANSGTTLVLTTGNGARFPDPALYGQYNATVWPAPQTFPFFANGTNAERVRITAKTGDTLTIVRTQEGTSARTIVAGDQIAAAIGPLDFTNIERWITGNAPAWTPSTSSINDSGGAGRFKIARNGFTFKGPSFVDPKRAGSLLQIGEYPALSDGAGSFVGASNTAVFITQDDMFNAIGPAATYGGLAITGQNSASIPNYFALSAWVERNSNAGDAWGGEIDILNRGTAGGGLGLVISGNRNYAGTTYADRGLVVSSAGTPDGFANGNSANWVTGIQIDGIVPSIGNGLMISDGITGSGGIQNGIHMKDIWGGFGHAAIWIHGGGTGKILWTSPDGLSDGTYIVGDSANGLSIKLGGTGGNFLVIDPGNAHIAFLVYGTMGAPLTGFTNLAISYNDGADQWQKQVKWKAGNTLVAGDKVLVVL